MMVDSIYKNEFAAMLDAASEVMHRNRDLLCELDSGNILYLYKQRLEY